MTSPVSVISSSSSRSSHSSLRSASNVSYATIEEAIKGFDTPPIRGSGTCSIRPDSELHGSGLENPDPTRRPSVVRISNLPDAVAAVNPRLEEKIREFLAGSGDNNPAVANNIHKVKVKVEELEERLIKLKMEADQVTNYFTTLESRLLRVASYRELEKLRLQVLEVEKITSLIASLNLRKEKLDASYNKEKDYLERHLLEGKRDLLMDRIGEAENLRKSIEKRNGAILEFLNIYLADSEVENYVKHLEHKTNMVLQIKLTENQLNQGREIIVLITNVKNL